MSEFGVTGKGSLPDAFVYSAPKENYQTGIFKDEQELDDLKKKKKKKWKKYSSAGAISVNKDVSWSIAVRKLWNSFAPLEGEVQKERRLNMGWG